MPVSNPANLNRDGRVDGWDESEWFFGRKAWDLLTLKDVYFK
jgi:hypothetical protein